MQTVINTSCVQLYYHDDTKIVHHHWTSELDSASLRESLLTGTEMLKQHHAQKWLSDNREIKPHADADVTWINNVWLPMAIQAGWKYWALVVPETEVARINMVEFVNEFYEKGVRVMVSSDLERAMAWLVNVDQPR